MIPIISVFTGCLGFCMLFHLQTRHYLRASVGGVCTYLTYLICSNWMENVFLPVFFASAAAALYAELLARLQRAPATLYLIIAVVPLVPGGTLFYTMSAWVREDWQKVHDYGMETGMFALAIATGMSLVWAVFDSFGKAKHRMEEE